MNNCVVIFLSGEPVAKGRPRFAMRGAGQRPIAYTPKETRTYEEALRWKAREAMGGRAQFVGPVTLAVTVTLPIPRSWSLKKQAQALEGALLPTKRPDADNFAKIAADALNCIVFADDSQVVDLFVRKRYGERPSLRIEASPFEVGLFAAEAA